MYRMLRDKNEGLKAAVVAFAQELVKTPSPSFEEAKVAGLVEAKSRATSEGRTTRPIRELMAFPFPG